MPTIIAGLTRFREILVIGVKSILVVREHAADLRGIGSTLGVAHVVEGSVRKAGDRIRVNARLDRDSQARAAAAEVRELAPGDPSVPDEDDKERWRAYWSRLIKFEDPNNQARFLDGLRKAGLPA